MSKPYLIPALLFIAYSSGAQNAQTDPVTISKAANIIKSGATNDILTNFYQVSLQNIASNGQLSISSTLYGLIDFDSSNKKVEDSRNFGNYKWARNIQITGTAKLDTNSTSKLKDYSIASYSGGLTFSLVNHREIADQTEPELHNLETDPNQYFQRSNNDVEVAMDSLHLSQADRKSINATINKFRGSNNIKDLDSRLAAELSRINKLDEYTSDISHIDSVCTRVAKEIKERGLLTIGGVYTKYNKGSNSDTVTFNANYLKGFYGSDSLKKPWEFNLSGNLRLFQPSVLINKLTQTYYGEIGLNKILVENKKGSSTMELKFFVSYTSAADSSFNKKNIAGNITYRILVFKTFWLPITLKWDVGGNLFGNFNFTFDIDKTSTSSTSSSN